MLASDAAAALRKSFALSSPNIALTAVRGGTGDLTICGGPRGASKKAVECSKRNALYSSL